MTVIAYILEADGSIPTYIRNGGYFPLQNENQPPQDLTLIGVTEDDSFQESFTLESLIDYVSEIYPEIEKEVVEQSVTNWWQLNAG